MRFLSLALALAAFTAFAPRAEAQALDAANVDAIEIDRPVAELHDRIRPAPDRDFIDTALVFTNTGRRGMRVLCVAFDDNGRTVGRARVRVPGLGLRFMLASDIAHGLDFVGSAQCSTDGRVLGSALLLGPGGATDLPANQGDHDGLTRVKFPVVVTR